MIKSNPCNENEPAQSLLRLSKIADLLGVKERDLHSARKYIAAFPPPKNATGILVFCPQEVLAWAKDRDVKAAIREAFRLRRLQQTDAVVDTMALHFISQRPAATQAKARRVYTNLRYDC
ncbi:MAG: hypothetical protein KGZ86_05140 [Candidatus Latescibacteria bacterium]|nr:hypothetical protein [Candidatus Latescibacterota bacterium]